jgi:hypothetical protein
VADKPAPPVSEREQKKKGNSGGLGGGAAWSAGPMRLDGPTGRLRKLPAQQAVKALEKDLGKRFVIRFKFQFEFESNSNSNSTQLNSK